MMLSSQKQRKTGSTIVDLLLDLNSCTTPPRIAMDDVVDKHPIFQIPDLAENILSFLLPESCHEANRLAASLLPVSKLFRRVFLHSLQSSDYKLTWNDAKYAHAIYNRRLLNWTHRHNLKILHFEAFLSPRRVNDFGQSVRIIEDVDWGNLTSLTLSWRPHPPRLPILSSDINRDINQQGVNVQRIANAYCMHHMDRICSFFVANCPRLENLTLEVPHINEDYGVHRELWNIQSLKSISISCPHMEYALAEIKNLQRLECLTINANWVSWQIVVTSASLQVLNIHGRFPGWKPIEKLNCPSLKLVTCGYSTDHPLQSFVGERGQLPYTFGGTTMSWIVANATAVVDEPSSCCEWVRMPVAEATQSDRICVGADCQIKIALNP